MEHKKIYHIGSVLDIILKKYGLDEKIKEYKILNSWKDVVGDKLSQYSKPQKIKNKILYVECNNSVWMQELSILKPKIIDRINKYVGEKKIEKIVFRIAENI